MSVLNLFSVKGTVFGKWYKTRADEATSSFHETRGESFSLSTSATIPTLPSDVDAAFMYKYASNYLQLNQFEQYEVSSFALLPDIKTKAFQNVNTTSHRSRHNQIYWGLGTQWYALGLGATSYVNRRLIARPRAFADYLKWVEEKSLNFTSDIPAEQNANDNNSFNQVPSLDLLMDIVLKRLRTSEGLSLNGIRHVFGEANNCDLGEKYVDSILRGAQLGLELGLADFDESNQILRLTKPNGFLYSNSIISSIFVFMEEVC